MAKSHQPVDLMRGEAARVAGHSSLRGIAGGLGPLVIGQFMNAGANFLVLAITAQLLGPASYGNFAVFLATSLIATQMSDLGLSRTVTLFGSRSRATGDLSAGESSYATALVFRLAFHLTAALAISFLYLVGRSSGNALLQYAALGGLTGLVTSLATFEGGILQAEGKFVGLAVMTALPGMLRLPSILAASRLLRLTEETAMLAYLLPQAVVAIVFLRQMPLARRWWRLASRSELSTIWRVSSWLALAGVVEMAYQRTDVIGLRVLSTSRETGIYAGAFIFVSVINVLITAVNALIYPAMAAAGARGDKAALGRIFSAGTTLLASGGIPAILFVVTIFPNIVDLVLGPAYKASILVVDVLALYGVFAVVQYNCGGLFIAAGRPRLVSGVSLFLFSLQLIGIVVLVPRWGAIGAAVAVSIAMVGALPVSWYFVTRLVGSAVPVTALAAAASISILTAAAALTLSGLIHAVAVLLVIKCVLWALTVGVLFLLFARQSLSTLNLAVARG